MLFKKFIIQKYRAINHAEIDVKVNLVPIIGINESGKTSFLKAILAFDKQSDKTQRGEHLDHRNRYELDENQQCTITAHVEIESLREIEEIQSKLKATNEDTRILDLKKLFESGQNLELKRTFPGKKYSISNIQSTAIKANQDIANSIYELLPQILYFDDFSDRVPEKIKFNINSGKLYADKINRSDEWHNIIKEIFKRNSSSIDTFLSIKDENVREGFKSDIEELLNELIVTEWTKLIDKVSGLFAEESTDLNLQLGITQNDSSISFEFKIKDRTNQNSRFFNIIERSKGFQWFFNFIMKLKFNPKYSGENDQAIYLLDEPGSYLHTTAQSELLIKLKEISNTNSIIYCTHSQYLLDPEQVNISNIKIAKKVSGQILISDFNSSGVSEDNGALSPLYRALQLNLPQIDEHGYQLITEGITDYYLLNILRNNLPEFIKGNLKIIPGSGAKQLTKLISYAIAYSKAYRVILDSDQEGREAFEDYQKFFGEYETKNFFKLKTISKNENVVLEDLLSNNVQNHLLKLTNGNSVKNSIPILYFSEQTVIDCFVDSLDQETKANIEIVSGVLNKLFE